MKSELRFTDTNAASDSKGRTWGLEGGLFWWLVGGVGVARKTNSDKSGTKSHRNANILK
jgi:hypothetical protein